MSINSLPFLLFLLVSVCLYYLVPRSIRYLILLGSSIFFYLSYSLRAALYLLITIVATYLASRLLEKISQDEKSNLSSAKENKSDIKQTFRRKKRVILAAALIFNFATLALFKYLNSWMGTVNSLFNVFGISFQFRPLDLILPLGISFYIFQTSGYLIDVYRGRVEPEHNFFKHALFTSYFPQMIQGPINRWSTLSPQLFSGCPFSADNLKYGIQLMMWGMLKKVFLADPLASAVNEIYTNYTQYSGIIIFLGAFLYCIQLYCDFSGGTDLVRGASQLFGVEMSENFKRPYFARSVDEFWRRWHISLGEWMKDYLFYPIALSAPMSRLSKRLRKRLNPRIGKVIGPSIATFIVFLAVGVWQGPGFSNIAYGIWNGSLMSLSMLFSGLFLSWKTHLKINESSFLFRCFQIIRTCVLVIIGRYFSRATSFLQAIGMLKRTVFNLGVTTISPSLLTSFGITPVLWLQITLCSLFLFGVSLAQENGIEIRKWLEKQNVFVQFVPVFLGVLLLIAFAYLNSEYTAIMYVYENV